VGGDGGVAGAPAPPPAACTLPSAPIPERPLLISSELAVARLTRLLWGPRSVVTPVLAAPLATSADVGALAARMIAQQRDGAVAVLQGWLGQDRAETVAADPEVAALVTGELRASLLDEQRRFLDDLLAHGGTLGDLLGADYTFVDERLSSLYQVQPVTGAGFVKEPFLAGSDRAGVLTQGAALMARPRASRRGTWVRATFQCTEIPPPPLGEPPVNTGPGTYRSRLEATTRQPCAGACHTLIDPMGFLFERFDPLGRSRTTDGGFPVDAHAQVLFDLPSGTLQDIDGAAALGALLAASCDVKACAALSILGLALGQPEFKYTASANQDLEVRAAFVDGGFDLARLFVSIAQSQLFLAP
jgi:hypothetical protein